MIDFGIACGKDNINNNVHIKGTLGYLAPEIILQQQQSVCVDYFSLGIVTYELIFGETPYQGKNITQAKELFVHREININSKITNRISQEGLNFILKLIRRKPNQRLGYSKGIQDIMKHKWFDNFKWENLKQRKMKAYYIPNCGDNYNKQFIQKMIKQIDINVNIQQCKEMNELKKLKFQNFTFIYNEEDYINTNEDEKDDDDDICEMNYVRRRGIFNNNILNAFPVFINENETDKEINDNDTKQHHLIIHRNQNTNTNTSNERNDTLKTKDKIYLPKIKVKRPGNYSCDKIRNTPLKNKNKMNINIKNDSYYYQQNQPLKYIQDYNVKQKNNSALCKSKFFQYNIMNHIIDTSSEQKENSFFSYTNKIRNLSLSNIHKNNKYHTRQNDNNFHNNNNRIPKKKYTTLKNINNNNNKARHYYYQGRYLNLPSLEISADYN